jgi:hypothetical protein
MRIVTTCPKEYVGVTRVFEDGAHLNLWKHVPTEELHLPLEADLVIFGGNYPVYHVLLDSIPQTKWLLWTSPLLQTELARVEMEGLLYYVREPRISRIWFGERAAADMFGAKGFYAPYPVAAERVVPTGDHQREGVGFMVPFGNPQKNVYNQLAAGRIFQQTHPEIVLKTGGMLPEQKRFADAIGLGYKDLGWRSGRDYHDDLHSCIMSLHASLSESFGYGCLDSMLLDTPCLGSPAMPWLPKGLGLVCPNPSDPAAIANSISQLYFTEPPVEVRPIALKVAESRNDALRISMGGWESLL